jgi:hypothetical protein
MQGSISASFIKIYGFDQMQAGLVYLPFALGCAIAPFILG